MCCVMGYTGHDLSAAKFKEYLLRTVMRGPDDQRVVEGPFGLMGFGRLAIMGLTPEGMQPFYRGADCVVCNGELYGFRFEKEILKRRGYKFQSDCDCEILLPLYYEYGLDMFRHLDAEFALILLYLIALLIFPMSSKSLLCHFIHAITTYLHFNPFPLLTH